MPSPKFQYPDHALHDVAQAFANELSKLHTKLDYPSYKQSTLTLQVLYTSESGAKVELRCTIGYGDVSVKHCALGPLMDEVYRRLDYDDKAEGAVNHESNSLTALPPPDDAPSSEETF